MRGPDDSQISEPTSVILWALARLGELLSQPYEEHEFYQHVIGLVAEVLAVERASLLLLRDGPPQHLEIVAAHGLPEEVLRRGQVEIAGSISGHVLSSGKTLLVSDIHRDGRFPLPHSESYYSESLLSVPLLVRGQPRGVININNKVSRAAPDREDRELLVVLAAQVGLVLENARLVAEVRGMNETLRERIAARTRELERTHDQLLRKEKLADLGEFSARMAHELNNPLVGISNAAQIVEAKVRAGAELATISASLQMIVSECVRLSTMLKQLLSFSRPMETTVVQFVAQQVIAQVVALAAPQFTMEGKGCCFSVTDDDSIPPLYGHPGEFQQVIHNLLENARQALDKGGAVELKLDWEKAEEGGWVRLVVADDGPGIPEGIQQQIFDAFFTTKPPGQGSGLGLALTRSLVEAHGGRIEVASRPGEGTRFTVRMPTIDLEALRANVPERGG